MSDNQNKSESKSNQQKTISVNLPNFPFMTGKVKGKNIVKCDGVTTTKLIMKDSRGAQYKVKKVTVEGMEGWESWQITSLSTNVQMFNNKMFVGWFFIGENASIRLTGNKTAYPAEGWSIAKAMRYAYIKTQKPLEYSKNNGQ